MGSFLFCFIRPMEGRLFSLVFPEGRGLIGGWALLANKLRSLGVRPIDLLSIALEDTISVKGVSDKGFVEGSCFADEVRYCKKGAIEVVWIQVWGG